MTFFEIFLKESSVFDATDIPFITFPKCGKSVKITPISSRKHNGGTATARS
jgi:hypothetical protein